RATASLTALRRSCAASAPTSGPSSSTSRRSAQTARTSVAFPTPAGPDTKTPRFAPAHSFSSSCGWSSASLSHSASRPACTCAPFRSSTLTGGAAGSGSDGAAATPDPHVTDEFGCTLTGPAGSVPVTVSSSDVHVMPTDDASAALAADVDVPGPRSRGSSDTVSPTVITLPSSASRSVAGDTDCRARLDPDSATDRAPYTVTGATITDAFSRRPAFDNVTSSNSTVPAGTSVAASPATAAVVRDPVNDTASHSRIPRAAMASACRRTTPRRESTAAVFSRAVNVSETAMVSALRSAQPEPRHRPPVRLGPADLPSVHPLLPRLEIPHLGVAGDPALAAHCERNVDDVRDDDRHDHQIAVEDRGGDEDRQHHPQPHRHVRRDRERVHLTHRNRADDKQ